MKKILLIGIPTIAIIILLYNFYVERNSVPTFKNYVALESKDFGSFYINKEEGLYGFIDGDLFWYNVVEKGKVVLRSIPKQYVKLRSEYYK